MARIFVSGTYLVVHGTTGQVADQNGVASISIRVSVPTLSNVFNLNPALVAQALGLTTTGLSLTSAPFAQDVDDQYLVTYTFAGLNPSQPWSFATADALSTFQLLGSDDEAPIGAHPNFANLKTKYGWNPDDPARPDGPGHFPRMMPAPLNTTASPVYGVQGWLSAGAEFRKTYVMRATPSDSWSKVGTIVSSPPDLYRAFGLVTQQGRNWLVLAPSLETIGTSAVRISERYRLSGPGGIVPEIYRYSGPL